MRKRSLFLMAGALAFGPDAGAQEPPERVRVFCSKADPARIKCTPPSPDCECVPDTLEIVFDGKDDSVLVLEDFSAGRRITATVVMDVKSEAMYSGIAGWSYGVFHDDTVLKLVSATTAGTDAAALMPGGIFFFDLTGHENVVTCATDERECPDPVPGGGFISAVVLRRYRYLLPGRFSIARAEYETAGKGAGETVLQFTNRLAARGSPPVAIGLWIGGRAAVPSNLIDGLVIEGNRGFHRGDADGNRKLNVLDALILIQARAGAAPGRIACEDAEDANDDGLLNLADGIHVLSYLFLDGPTPPAPSCGLDTTPDALGCREGDC